MKSFLITAAILGLASTVPACALAQHAEHGAQAKGSVTKATSAPSAPSASNAPRIQIAVTSEGFVPASTKVKVGQQLTLLVTRKVERTCATEIVFKELGINKQLPLNETVEITLTPKKAGKIRFACGMDMIAGELVAE